METARYLPDRTGFRSAVALIAVLAVCGPALADMPDFDVKARCLWVASINGPPSQTTIEECYKTEQSAYDALKPDWDALPASVRDHCLAVTRLPNLDSFMILKVCAQQEAAAATSNQKFEFHR